MGIAPLVLTRLAQIFLYGPMVWPPLLARLGIGTKSGQPAEVSGFMLGTEGQVCFPQLRFGQGAVQGLLLSDPPPVFLERLGYFTAGLGLARKEVTITGEGRDSRATIYAPQVEQPGYDTPWQAGTWQKDWGEIALFALDEVLEHKGHVSPGRLAQMMPMILVRAAARKAAGRQVPTSVRSDMQADHVEVHEKHDRHAGFFLTREYMLQHPRFDGGKSPPVRREVFVATDAAIVLPYDPVHDRVLLVEQFRMGPYGRGDPHPWMLEPVAGRVDPGETPETTARRECVEEAGLSLGRLEHISSHYCSPGCSTEYFHCYIALCDLPDLAKGQGGLDSEDEDIRTHVLPFDRAMALIPSGEAANGPLILCLLWLRQERDRLRAGA